MSEIVFIPLMSTSSNLVPVIGIRNIAMCKPIEVSVTILANYFTSSPFLLSPKPGVSESEILGNPGLLISTLYISDV